MTDDLRPAQKLPLLSETDLSLSLHRQKILAKQLRDAVRLAEPQALARLKTHHPHPDRLETATLKLADAQCVVAREAGLPSWPALKAHVETMERTRREIETGAPAPDGECPTLHIRCGHDIETALRQAGFVGDFLVFADPICQGPISAGPDYLQRRADFIAEGYPGQSASEAEKTLSTALETLEQAGRYARICLWFEHDPYDQLLLCRVLDRLKSICVCDRQVEIVSLDGFPGFRKFIGIGQLSPSALRHLYANRQPVVEAAYTQGTQAWQALQAPTPEALCGLAKRPNPALPFLSAALLRYLADLPSRSNGLSFTEHATLNMLLEGAQPCGLMFGRFIREIDPLPFHGDLMFWGDLLRLTRADDPPLRLLPCEKDVPWSNRRMELTDTGRRILEAKRDFASCGPAPRYQGGVTCFAPPDWRWNAQTQTVVALDG